MLKIAKFPDHYNYCLKSFLDSTPTTESSKENETEDYLKDKETNESTCKYIQNYEHNKLRPLVINIPKKYIYEIYSGDRSTNNPKIVLRNVTSSSSELTVVKSGRSIRKKSTPCYKSKDTSETEVQHSDEEISEESGTYIQNHYRNKFIPFSSNV